MTRPVQVHTASGAYDILIGPRTLASDTSWEGLGRDGVALVVTNTTVGPLYARALRDRLEPMFRTVGVIELPDGEEHKRWSAVEGVIDALLDLRADRQCLLVALGGGVIGDITGFAAACYMRGVEFVQAPTTLLAQVDSSVGGKTGINHPKGKNMVGAFHQPVRVLADTDALSTLRQREFVAGIAEVIKYGAVADLAFLSWLEENMERLLARDPDALTHAIRRSCEIKASVVAADEKELGVRAILNFGHTFGHAIEAGLGYGTWLHGEAVGCGMVMAAEVSRREGLIDTSQSRRIASLVERAGLPVRAPALGAQRYLDLMRSDKKARSGSIRFVLLAGPGKATVQTVNDELLAAVASDFEA